jgi:hypothetical protein
MAQRGPRLNDLDEPEYGENPRRRSATGWLGQVRRHILPVAIGGAAILFVLVLLVVWGGSGDGNKAAEDGSGEESLEARLNKLEFQHNMILEEVNTIQESSSAGIRQQELAKLRKAVTDLEDRLAGMEEKLADRREVGGPEPEMEEEYGDGVGLHTVKQGETLFSIGQRYEVSVDKLREWNDIGEGEYIQPGQELKVAP